ncbi:MAG: hypothetical protein U1E14_10400 [Geminicoccaceae bacterium]
MVEDDLRVGMGPGDGRTVGHLAGVELQVEGQAVRLQPGEAAPPGVVVEVVAVGEADRLVGVAVDDVADAAGVGEGGVRCQRAVDVGVRQVGEGDDAVREAAGALRVGDRLQPAGLLDRDLVGDLGLQVDGLHHLEPGHVGAEVGQQVVAAQPGGVADQAGDDRGRQPRIVEQVAVPQMVVGVDDAHRPAPQSRAKTWCWTRFFSMNAQS